MTSMTYAEPVTPQSPLDRVALAQVGQSYPPRRTLRTSEPAPWPGLLPAIVAAGLFTRGQGRHVARGDR